MRLDIVRIGEGLTSQGQQDVTDEDAGLRGCAIRLRAENDQPGAVIGQPDRMQAYSDESAGDVTVGENRVDNGIDSLARNGDTPVPREAAGVDADHAARGIDQSAAGTAGVEIEIGADKTFDVTVAPCAPGAPERTEDSETGAGPILSAASNCENHISYLKRCGRGEFGCRAGGGIGLQNGEIGGGIASGEACGDGAVIGENDGEVVIAAHGMVCRDDDSVAPDDAAGREALIPIDGRNSARGVSDGVGERGGKCGELIETD